MTTAEEIRVLNDYKNNLKTDVDYIYNEFHEAMIEVIRNGEYDEEFLPLIQRELRDRFIKEVQTNYY